jgi:transcriptional regulator with XRE-family HTH domain
MAHPKYLRDKARQLRISKKLTIDELAERLALPRTTIYYWVRDLPTELSTESLARQSAARRRASLAHQAKHRRLREEAYEEGLVMYPSLVATPTFRDFVCLYIAEGSKRSRHNVEICNSDAAVVRLGDRWIRHFTRNSMDYRIQYHADQDLEELRAFWGNELAIDPTSIQLKRKSNSNGLTGRQWRSRHGVMSVRTGDTYLRARLQAWMDCIRREWV